MPIRILGGRYLSQAFSIKKAFHGIVGLSIAVFRIYFEIIETAFDKA